MLKSLVPKLLCPVCCDAQATLRVDVFAENSEHVRNGVLVCSACETTFPVEENLLELVHPSLLDPEGTARFARRFDRELSACGVTFAERSATPDLSAQLTQRRHFDWFAENSTQTYAQYQASAFWVAEDSLTFGSWKARVGPGAWILDLGCANGRSAWPFLDGQVTVIGCDISKKLVRQAIERADVEGARERTTFVVADCDRLAFRADAFDYAVTYGVLHHLPDPERTCREIQRVIRPGGAHLGSENNRTIFRGLFDALMRWRPLWLEEAGSEPLISRQMLERWTRGLPVRLTCSTSVFLPPHLLNVAGRSAAYHLLRISDRVCGSVPMLNMQGGLIIFDLRKAGQPAAS